jgi:membrane protein
MNWRTAHLPLLSLWSERATRLMQTLRAWPWFDTLRTLRQRFREDHLGLTAGSLTFTTLISLVPLATVTLALFSAFPMFGKFQDTLQKYLIQSLVPDHIAKPVLAALTQFATKANRLGVLGLVVLVVTALALVFTIDRTLNKLWRVQKARPLAQRVLVYWAGLTLGPLVLGASLTLTSFVIRASRDWASALPGGVGVLLEVVEFALLFGGASCLFRFVPNTHVRWEHALAGGFFVAVGFEAAKRALGWYLASVPSYSVIYGAFATVPILLLWVYTGWVIVLLGAVIAAYAPSLAMRVTRVAVRPGYRFGLALAVLKLLKQARDDHQGGLSLEDLASRLRVDPLQVEPVVEELAALNWCARLDESGAQRHVLLVELAHTPARPLLDLMLLADDTAAANFRARTGFDRLSAADLL